MGNVRMCIWSKNSARKDQRSFLIIMIRLKFVVKLISTRDMGFVILQHHHVTVPFKQHKTLFSHFCIASDTFCQSKNWEWIINTWVNYQCLCNTSTKEVGKYCHTIFINFQLLTHRNYNLNFSFDIYLFYHWQ